MTLILVILMRLDEIKLITKNKLETPFTYEIEIIFQKLNFDFNFIKKIKLF